MKNLIISGVCFLILASCTPKPIEIVAEPAPRKEEGFNSLDYGHKEEFLVRREIRPLAAIKIKKQPTPKQIAKKEIVKKVEKSKPKTKSKPKVSITTKAPTRLKTVIPEKPSTQPKKAKEILFKLSFYTTLPSENGGYSITATGEKLVGLKNTVASNYYAIGTKIYLEGFGTMRVADRGGSNFNAYNRLDVLIQRKSGESNIQYLKRVNNMGVPTVKGYVIKS